MPAQTKGSVFKVRNGYGIRWPEDGKWPQKTGFRTKTEARDWFDENVKPRLSAAPRAPTSPSTHSAKGSCSGTPRRSLSVRFRRSGSGSQRPGQRSATGPSPNSSTPPPTSRLGAARCPRAAATG